MTTNTIRSRNGPWEASIQQINKIDGVADGAYIMNVNRLQELNDRIFERNIPSTILQQQFSQRPVSTKYSLLPLFDKYKEPTVPIETHQIYKQEEVFNPGTSAPFNGFINAINDESRLRNQFFALQRCEQSVYVPSSQSDLYTVNIPQKSIQQEDSNGTNYDDRSLLFKEEDFDPFNPNVFRLGGSLFDNHTRQQLKGVSDENSNKSTRVRLGNNTWK